MSQLRGFREAAGLTQTQLGERVGVVRQTISAWERGDRSPNVAQLGRIAVACGVPMAYLIGLSTPTGARWNVCGVEGR